MNEQDIIDAIQAIEGVSEAQVMARVHMINGETLLQVNVYFPTEPPTLEIHVGDNVGVEAKVK